MQTFIMMTRPPLKQPTTVRNPETLADRVLNRVGDECPEVHWLHHYKATGPYWFVDMFEAPTVPEAFHVARVVHEVAHARADVWPVSEAKRLLRHHPELAKVA
ncbi:MAG: hypothetical protein ACE5FN_09305 [Leptospirillia bacterium]